MHSTVRLGGRPVSLETCGTELCIVLSSGQGELHDLAASPSPRRVRTMPDVAAAGFVTPLGDSDGSAGPTLCATLSTDKSRPVLKLYHPSTATLAAELATPAVVGMAPFKLTCAGAKLCVVGGVFGVTAIFEARTSSVAAPRITLLATVDGGPQRSPCSCALLAATHLLLGRKDGTLLACPWLEERAPADADSGAGGRSAAVEGEESPPPNGSDSSPADSSPSDPQRMEAALHASSPQPSPPSSPPPSLLPSCPAPSSPPPSPPSADEEAAAMHPPDLLADAGADAEVDEV